MTKLITVFGATGNQGGSVIKTILNDAKLSKEFKIRAITRDVTKPAAKALAAKGVEVVSADLNSVSSLESALKGSHTIFLVTNFWETGSAATEISQGRNVIDVASQLFPKPHFIFSSLINVTKATEGRLTEVKHFNSKNDIELYAVENGLPSTFVLAGYFMSNFEQMLRKREDASGDYDLAFPFGQDAQLPLFHVQEDMGKFVKPALLEPVHFIKPETNHIFAATDYYSVSRIVSQFKEVTGRTLHFTQLPSEAFESFFPDFMKKEMLQNHLLMKEGEVGYYGGADLRSSREAVRETGECLTSWKQWVAQTQFA